MKIIISVLITISLTSCSVFTQREWTKYDREKIDNVRTNQTMLLAKVAVEYEQIGQKDKAEQILDRATEIAKTIKATEQKSEEYLNDEYMLTEIAIA